MNQEDRDFLRAIKALVAISRANFPEKSEIVITATGRQTATITVPAYTLSELLIEEPKE